MTRISGEDKEKKKGEEKNIGVVNAHVNRVVMTVDFSPPYLF